MATVGEVARAIEKVADIIGQWMAGEDKRRLRSAVDIADRIMKRYKQIDGKDKTINKWMGEFYDRIA